MDTFWKGSFLQKHYRRIVFIPLWLMTEDDWAILDYQHLSEEQQNKIHRLWVAGRLIGFWLLMYYRHGGKRVVPKTKGTRPDFITDKEVKEISGDYDRKEKSAVLPEGEHGLHGGKDGYYFPGTSEEYERFEDLEGDYFYSRQA